MKYLLILSLFLVSCSPTLQDKIEIKNRFYDTKTKLYVTEARCFKQGIPSIFNRSKICIGYLGMPSSSSFAISWVKNYTAYFPKETKNFIIDKLVFNIITLTPYLIEIELVNDISIPSEYFQK